MWDSLAGCPHFSFWKNLMRCWWDSLSDTLVVKATSHASMHTMSGYWCISQEWIWWTFHISSAETSRGWLLLCRRRLLNSSTIAFIIMRSSRSLLCISLVCRASHGKTLFPVSSLQLQQLIRRLSMLWVKLHISMEVRRWRLLVCWHMSPIREVGGDCLQQPDEYYVQLGWKWSHCRHQQHKYRYKTEAISLCRMRVLQEAMTLISSSSMMMWALLPQSSGRLFRSRRPR